MLCNKQNCPGLLPLITLRAKQVQKCQIIQLHQLYEWRWNDDAKIRVTLTSSFRWSPSRLGQAVGASPVAQYSPYRADKLYQVWFTSRIPWATNAFPFFKRAIISSSSRDRTPTPLIERDGNKLESINLLHLLASGQRVTMRLHEKRIRNWPAASSSPSFHWW